MNNTNNTPHGFQEDGTEIEYKAHQVTKHVTDRADKRKREFEAQQSLSREFERELKRNNSLYLEENAE